MGTGHGVNHWTGKDILLTAWRHGLYDCEGFYKDGCGDELPRRGQKCSGPVQRGCVPRGQGVALAIIIGRGKERTTTMIAVTS
jgi:hypothetical protein